MANVSRAGGTKRLMVEQMSAVESELLQPFNQVGQMTQGGFCCFMTNKSSRTSYFLQIFLQVYTIILSQILH